jgi:hypothetical protein
MTANTSTVPPEHIAVITAAVAEILGDVARIVSITPIAAPHLVSTRSAWIVEGRAALMGSHRPHIHGGGSARWR